MVTQLGSFLPTENNYMGIISTGLGFTVSSGSISQDICLSEKDESLTFKWNYNSEEFIEWCNTQYQDFFTVDLTTNTGTQNLFYRNVDDLCSSVFATNLSFDQSYPGCTPTGGNDCNVWSTGWQSETIDISGITANLSDEDVTISFSAGDVGDSIYDTAILLDEISIEQSEN